MSNIPAETLACFDGNELRAKVYLDRYAGPGETTWLHTATRILAGLRELSEYDKLLTTNEASQLYDMLINFNFVPGGRIINTVGLNTNLTLYNCLTLPRPHDSIEGIMSTASNLAMALKKGAGVGLRLDSLRPKGAKVAASNGLSSGSVAFGSLFNSVVGTINQGGSRRGALLLAHRINHDDFWDFVEAKQKLEAWNNTNITVMLTRDEIDKYPDRWQKIIECAHTTGEPGVLFLDTAKAVYKGGDKFPFEGVNACSEVLLPAYGCCLLGSMNLAKIECLNVFRDQVILAIKFLHLCHLYAIKHNRFPLDQCKDVTQKTMKIGLGVMGLAHRFFEKKLVYGSDASQSECHTIWSIMKNTATTASMEIASKLKLSTKMANMDLLSCPPTGTTSLLVGTSSGIEPVFNLVSKRTDRLGEHIIYDPYYERADHSIPKPEWLVDSTMVDPLDRVRVQATIQCYLDNSISSTVNLPFGATTEYVKKVFELAAKLGCVSITVYRDGSRSGVYNSAEPKQTESTQPEQIEIKQLSPTRPFKLSGSTYKFTFGQHNIYICINASQAGEPFEVFVNSPGVNEPWAKAATIFISRLLRAGEPVESIASKLSRITSDSSCWVNGDCITSQPAAIGYALKDFVSEANSTNKPQDYKHVETETSSAFGPFAAVNPFTNPYPGVTVGTYGFACPDCGEMLTKTGKCKNCPSCGYESCS